MPILGSFHHVHIISEDPEAAAEWYAGVFGAEITASVERRGARNVSLRLGEAALNIRGIRETDIIGQVDKDKPLGIHHFGFIVEDLEEMIRRIEEHGGKLAEPLLTGSTGNTVAFVAGPDGVIIELVQPPKE